MIAAQNPLRRAGGTAFYFFQIMKTKNEPERVDTGALTKFFRAFGPRCIVQVCVDGEIRDVEATAIRKYGREKQYVPVLVLKERK